MQGLVRRAAKGVSLFVVDEQRAVEQRAIALVVDGAVGRSVRQDALLFTTLGLLTIRVTCVGHHVQSFWVVESGFGCFGHRQQAAIVRRIGGYLLRYDDAVFGVHRCLHVVG